MERIVAPYGSWASPITAAKATASAIGLSRTQIDGEAIYWLERRPTEQGRNVVVRRAPDGAVQDVTPPGFNIRTRVHEYGGGHYIAVDDVIYFANDADQRVYRQPVGGLPEPLTPEREGFRYADFCLDRKREHLLCVREDHSGPGEAVNTLVVIDLPEGGPGWVLDVGPELHDFYSDPRISPDGDRMCWLAWRHPNMPWDGTELWLADVREDGEPLNARRVAGGPTESIFQPAWSPDGVLHFVSDRSGWWNLYRLVDGRTEALHPMAAEFGQPQWVFGVSTYGFIAAETILCTYFQSGKSHLARLWPATGRLAEIETPYREITDLRVSGACAVMLAGSPQLPGSLIRLDLSGGDLTVLAATGPAVDPDILSIPELITFPTSSELEAYGYFYPPCSPSHRAPDGELPPLLVMSHGGPTGLTSTTLDMEYQFWTSRGFALLDVDYGGSTGHGRAYRERLNGQWGVVDLADCVNGALYLAAQGRVDRDRLAIRGGSAGGYTTLCALTFTDVFKAGASYYGVSDLGALTETHKFESRYLDSLVGPYPKRRDLYEARSPIFHTDRLSSPVILFQGLDDPVVLPAQSEKIYAALKAKGVPVAYIPFEGEQHGFRKAENIIRALEAELYFYGKVFGFAPADEIAPVAIKNLAMSDE